MLISLSFGLGRLGALARELALWGGVLLLLAGVLSLYRGWKQRKLTTLIDETPRSDIADVRSAGTVRVRGEIVPQSERDPFTSPITGEDDAVLSAWEIKERYDTPKTKSWERAAWGVRAVPFYLSDGTGNILVDIDDAVVGNETEDVFTPETILASEGVSIEGLRCEFETFDVHVETGYEESPPRRVSEFVETTDGISADPMTTDIGDHNVERSRRKYLEQTLQPGDHVSVVGSVVPRREGMESAAHPRDLVFTQIDQARLRLSERPFEEIADGGGALLFGALTSVSGFTLLILWGVL